MGLAWQQGPLATTHRNDIRQTSRHLVVRDGQNNRAAWCYVEAWPEVARVSHIATWSGRTNGT
jgi:hypothetical protein